MSAPRSWLADASVLIARDDADDPQYEGACAVLGRLDRVLTIDLAYYEVANVAMRRGGQTDADRALAVVEALTYAGRLVRSDEVVLSSAAAIALEHGISAYDAAYVAAARVTGAQLVSCDVRDLVSRGLAVTPADAVA